VFFVDGVHRNLARPMLAPWQTNHTSAKIDVLPLQTAVWNLSGAVLLAAAHSRVPRHDNFCLTLGPVFVNCEGQVCGLRRIGMDSMNEPGRREQQNGHRSSARWRYGLGKVVESW
jgi:hypothetical protein